MIVYLMLWVLGKCWKLRLVVNAWLYTQEQWRTLIFSPRRASLAQARASEVHSWSLRELSLRRRAPVLSEIHLAQARRSRLSERTWKLPVSLFELSPRRKELAWVREPSRLSKTFLPEQGTVREVCLFCCFSILGCWPYVWIDYTFKAWIGWLCMSEMI